MCVCVCACIYKVCLMFFPSLKLISCTKGFHEAEECRSTDEYFTTAHDLCLQREWNHTAPVVHTCTHTVHRTSLVSHAECLASVELLPDWDLMSPEPCLFLHLWVWLSAFHFLTETCWSCATTCFATSDQTNTFVCFRLFACIISCYLPVITLTECFIHHHIPGAWIILPLSHN